MNINPIIAVLILKNIITQDEGQAVVDFVHDKPQSTVLNDSINDIKPLLVPVEAIMPQLGPVGPAQRDEEIAARTAQVTALPVTTDATVTDDNGFHHPAPVETDKPDSSEKTETDKPAKTTSVKKSDTKQTKK